MFVLSSIKKKIPGIRDKRTSFEKAVDWVRRYRIPEGGVVIHHKTNRVTTEVTGYLIPTLYSAGEKGLALELAKWEASVQQPDGSFLAPDGIPYTFDTAQVVRGFLSVLDEKPVENNISKACDFIISQINEYGEIHTPSYNSWKLPDGSMFSEYCNLYILPPLIEAGKKLEKPMYIEAAQKALQFYKVKPDLVEFKSELGTLSHIFGYIMEALVDLGEMELARKGLEQAKTIQRKDGSIPAYPGVHWICSTGMAQLAIAWWKIGDYEPARRAFEYLEKLQNPDGGFYGGYGNGAQYFPREEISWAAKYFIDLYLLTKGKNDG